MRKADAPPAGWYPDPAGGARLRWWDGLDWTDHWRAPPGPRVPKVPEPDTSTTREEPTGRPGRVPARRTRDETAEIMAEVRRVARDEVERGVHLLSDRARDATSRLDSLVSQYGDRVMRGLRIAGIVAVVLVVLWLVLQTFGQASLLDWLGDRIDTIVDGD